MSTRRLALVCGVALGFLLVPGMAWAQSGIAGVVRDASGAVLPGVTVEAASPALIEKVRTAVTDGEGAYRLVDLRPGVYAVTFTLPGFSTSVRDGIELPAGFTATVSVELVVGAVEETITVTGAAPLVDVQSVATQQVFSQELLESIPSNRSLPGYAQLTPGVVMGLGLGATSGSAYEMRTTIHGAPSGETIFALDGMLQGSVEGSGGQMLYRNAQAYVGEVNIVTGGGTAELPYGAGMVNIIPKEGGNRFSGSLFGQYSGKGMAASNITDELSAIGFTDDGLNNLVKKWEISGSFGGRIVRDKLWFFGSLSNLASVQTRAGIYDNLTPQGWAYTPDLSRPAETRNDQVSENMRLTWQATPKHKISAYMDITPFAVHHRNDQFPLAPESTGNTVYRPTSFSILSWKSPATTRLLFDVAAAHKQVDFNIRRHTTESCRCSAPDVDFDDIAVVEATTGQQWRSAAANVSPGGQEYGHSIPNSMRYFATASYITGSHAVKGGVQFLHGVEKFTKETNGARAYTLRNGVPSSIALYAHPMEYTSRVDGELGLFIQDQWTFKRMTLTGGLRWDYFKASADPQTLPANLWMPAREFAGTENAPLWKDFNPRMAASFDVFGDGRTAVKVSFNRASALGGIGLGNNHPVLRSIANVTRTWNDANRDFNPNCDLVNPLANGECGQISNLNFGQNNPNATTYDPELLTGLRPYNWETTALVQRQITNGISVSFGYYRRDFKNHTVTDNTLVTPADYSPYCITAPVDARLPGGGGYQLCGLQDVSPALFGRNLSVVRPAQNFGDIKQTYNAFDITQSIRMPNGGQISGGVSFARTQNKVCIVVDSPSGPSLGLGSTHVAQPNVTGNAWPSSFCDVKPPFQPNLSLVGFSPLPWLGITASATFRIPPPTAIGAAYTVGNAQIAPSLGRNLSSGVNGTVNAELIQPGTMYEDYAKQLDFRISKRFQRGTRRISTNLDLYNFFNSAGVTTLNETYGAQWLRPTLLQLGRYFQVSAQFDF
jgi:hypothetical protein